jgi:D-alanyl-D-alanine carboxypeptidase (penicillin-binding protein 5/6)
MYKLQKTKIFTGVLVLLFFISAFHVNGFAQFESSAGSAILIEASSGTVLYEKNPDKAVPPASITKLMTLLLGFEAVDQGKTTWDDMVPISESAWKMGGSKMFLEVGKQIKYRDLVTGISVVSANDGCVALAEYLYGSESAFVAVMNERAKKLGLTKTHFENATGLPAEGHVMSARDISTLADYLIEKHPDILKIESQREFTYNNIRQFNRNPLLGAFQGADGLKTGWTDAAGYCLVGTAKQEDMRLIAVVLNTRNEQERLTASQELSNYGFKNFVKTTVKNSGDIVGSIDVKKGKKLTVPVKVQDNITVVIPSARKNDIKIEAVKDKDSLNAPAAAGTAVGKLEVKLDGRVLASSAISTAEDVSKAGFFELLFRAIGNFFKSLF